MRRGVDHDEKDQAALVQEDTARPGPGGGSSTAQNRLSRNDIARLAQSAPTQIDYRRAHGHALGGVNPPMNGLMVVDFTGAFG